MCSVVSLNQPAPPALRVVRVTAVVVTVLALAGAVATAALIFAAGFTVLWPALIACACLAVLCAVGFLIAHCIIASGKETLDVVQVPTRNEVNGHATLLGAMSKDTPLSDALRTLGNKKGIRIPKSDIGAICDCVKKIVERKTKLNITSLTLRDLSSTHANEIRSFNLHILGIKSLSNLLPILIAILSLISSSRFSIKILAGKYCIWSISTDKSMSNSAKWHIMNSIYSTFNYGNPESIPEDQQEITRETVSRFGGDRVFVTHYDSNGALVIDPPPQAESGPTFE